MTLTLKLDQMVAVMPTLAGHDLSGSLTLATIGPVAGGRRGFRSLARIDIPTKPDDIVEAAYNLLPHVLREDDVDVILAAWETPQAPASPALTGIRLFLKAAGVPVVGCFRVADGTTFDINPDAAPCCAAGHPLPSLPNAVDLAGAGPHVSADPSNTRQARIDSVQPTAAAADVAAAAAITGPVDVSASSRAQVLHLWATIFGVGSRRLIPAEQIPAADLAAAAAGAHDLTLRDAVITWVTPDQALDPQVFGDFWDQITDRLGARRPAPKTLLPRLAALCRRLPDDDLSVHALVICAAAFWAHGDGLLARATLDRAHQIDPDNRATNLYRRLIDLGLRPNAKPI